MYKHTVYNEEPTPQFIKNFFSKNGYDRLGKHHSNYIRIPKEKVYLVVEGDNVLRGAKIEKVFFYHSGYYLIYANIAGLGHRLLNYHNYVFDSKEDYLIENYSDIFGEYNTYLDEVVGIFGGEVRERNNSESYIVKWGWVDNKPLAIHSDFIVEYDVATKRISCIYDFDDKKYKYNTKEECIADNEVAVCDFDNENEPKKEVCVDVTTSFHFSSNLTIEEIKAKVRESFGGKDYRCFINQELVIDDC